MTFDNCKMKFLLLDNGGDNVSSLKDLCLLLVRLDF